jgi:phosphopantetheinyl transferase
VGSGIFWCETTLSQAAAWRHQLETAQDANHYRSHLASAKDRSLASRVLLRALLLRQWRDGRAYAPVDHTPTGAPYLRAWPECAISVSHSVHAAAVAACEGSAIGIDIEWVDPGLSMMPAIRKLFHPREARMLAAMESPMQLNAFFAWWAAKEAVAKCMGQGMALPLASILIPSPLGAGPALGLTTPVWVTALPAPAGYRAALACQGDGHKRMIVTRVDVEEISAQTLNPSSRLKAIPVSEFRISKTELCSSVEQPKEHQEIASVSARFMFEQAVEDVGPSGLSDQRRS